MEEEADWQKKFDDEIQQCRADILRASIPGAWPEKGEPAQVPPKTSGIRSFEDLTSGRQKARLPENEAQADRAVASDETPTTQGKDVPGDSPSKQPGQAGNKNESEIPQFNLAGRIMAEQRKATSLQRKRPAAKNNTSHHHTATGTVGQIINESKQKHAGSEEKTQSPAAQGNASDTQAHSPAVHYVISGIETVDASQRQIVTDIVTRDIARFCGSLSGVESTS